MLPLEHLVIPVTVVSALANATWHKAASIVIPQKSATRCAGMLRAHGLPCT